MVNNSTNINKTNNHISPHITKTQKRPRHMTLEIQGQAHKCDVVKLVSGISSLSLS
jgi:hypothetical protein